MEKEMSTASASSTSTSVRPAFCWAKLATGAGAAKARLSQADAAKSIQATDSREDRIIRILQSAMLAWGGAERYVPIRLIHGFGTCSVDSISMPKPVTPI